MASHRLPGTPVTAIRSTSINPSFAPAQHYLAYSPLAGDAGYNQISQLNQTFVSRRFRTTSEVAWPARYPYLYTALGSPGGLYAVKHQGLGPLLLYRASNF